MLICMFDRQADNLPGGIQFNQKIFTCTPRLADFPVRKLNKNRICILKLLCFHFTPAAGPHSTPPKTPAPVPPPM